MAPKRLPTAPIFNSEKAQAVVKAVDTIAGKPLSWWFFVLMISLIALLCAISWFLLKRTDAQQESINKQHLALLSYVQNDQKALLDEVREGNSTRQTLVDALRQNAIAYDRATRVLDKIEARQSREQ